MGPWERHPSHACWSMSSCIPTVLGACATARTTSLLDTRYDVGSASVSGPLRASGKLHHLMYRGSHVPWKNDLWTLRHSPPGAVLGLLEAGGQPPQPGQGLPGGLCQERMPRSRRMLAVKKQIPLCHGHARREPPSVTHVGKGQGTAIQAPAGHLGHTTLLVRGGIRDHGVKQG